MLEGDVCFPFLFVFLLSLHLCPVQLKNRLAQDKIFYGDPKYVRSCVFIAHFVFVHTTRHLTHNPSQTQTQINHVVLSS